MDYKFLPDLFFRSPFYSYADYDLKRLGEVLARPAFRNAIWLASPVFYRALEKRAFCFDRLSPKERFTLAKYYNRICFRPTPFGHFAAFTLLEWGGSGQTRLVPEEQAILHLLPDNALPPAETGQPLIVNPTLYRLGGTWRYYSTVADARGHYQFMLQEMDAAPFTNQLFRWLEKTPRTAADLVLWIVQATGCTHPEAEDYLAFLVEEEVLYTGARRAMITTEKARSYPLDGQVLLAGGPPAYGAVERCLLSGGLPDEDQQELEEAVLFLQKLAVPSENNQLAEFIHDFGQRFDRQKVPLLTALDPDTGLGYGGQAPTGPDGSVIGELPFPDKVPADTPQPWTGLRRLLFRCWLGNQQRGAYEPVVLGTGEPEMPGAPAPLLPNTQALLFRKTAGFLVLEQLGGASATQLIGRFSACSADTHALCRRLAETEIAANPAVVFADLDQLSDVHVDNINRRQPIYSYEIPVNVYARQSAERQLTPADLLLSVRGGELILESKKLGKRVIPRLSTAYNYHHNELALFRLLGDLQYQGLAASPLPDLEQLFPGLPFYPRIVYGKTVLALAKWIFTAGQLTGLSGPDLRERYQLPRLVSLGATDQQLVFDLSEPAECAFLSQCLAGQSSVRIQEYLPPDGSVSSAGQPLTGQFIAFRKHDLPIYSGLEPDAPFRTKIVRDLLLGSDWLYLKIYCTEPAADRLLARVIYPLIRRYRKRLAGWFFIRYADPAPHLRLRVRFTGGDTGNFLIALRESLRKKKLDGLVKSLQADTYRRELERYGPEMIVQTERIFCAGSELVAASLTAPAGQAAYGLGIRTARQMIACFLPATQDQFRFTSALAESFSQEFGMTGNFKLGLDQKYRSLKKEISTWLQDPAIATKQQALATEMKKAAQMTARYPAVKRERLLADLVHMQLNRTFAADQRRHELLVHDGLRRYLGSLLARQKN